MMIKPFSIDGKPAKFNLSSFILLEPESYLKWIDITMRSLYNEMGMESFYKRKEQLLKTISSLPDSEQEKYSKKWFSDMKAHLESSASSGSLLVVNSHLERFLNYDEEYIKEISSVGIWQFVVKYEVFPMQDILIKNILTHCADVEVASKEVDILHHQKAYSKIADAVHASPTLLLYIRPQLQNYVAASKTDKEILLVQTFGLLEFLFSQVPMMDVVLNKKGITQTRCFTPMLHTHDHQTIKPGQAFFHFIQDLLGVETIGQMEILGQKCSKDGYYSTASEATLKRWSSGKEFPKPKTFFRFMKTCLKNANKDNRELQDLIWYYYWGAKRFYLIQKFIQYILQSAEHRKLFFNLSEAETICEWMVGRYEFWLQHWSAQM